MFVCQRHHVEVQYKTTKPQHKCHYLTWIEFCVSDLKHLCHNCDCIGIFCMSCNAIYSWSLILEMKERTADLCHVQFDVVIDIN